MPPDLADLQALVGFMRAQGVVSLKAEGVEIILGPAPARPVDMAPTSPAIPQKSDADAYDEILFASSLGFPDDDEPGVPQ